VKGCDINSNINTISRLWAEGGGGEKNYAGVASWQGK